MRRGAYHLCVVLAVGCGAGPAVQGPSATVARYGRALSEADARTTWALLDDDARRGRTEREHAALMRSYREELGAQGTALERAARANAVRARARVSLRSGETIVLVLEEGRWRIDGGVLDAAGLGTPEDAVAAFRRALMRRDLPGIERVLARQTRAEWEDELRRVVEALADPDDLEIEIEGNRARVRLTGGGSLELVRESGEWRVVDVHDPP